MTVVQSAIYSRYKNPRVGYVVIAFIIVTNVFVMVSNWHRGMSRVMGLVQMLGLLVFVVVIYRWQRANKIVIDRDSRTIRYGRFFSQEECVYAFQELDGFYTTFEQNKNGKAKVLHLLKGKRRIKKLSGFTYANIDEMEAVIGEMLVRVVR